LLSHDLSSLHDFNVMLVPQIRELLHKTIHLPSDSHD
jgi:hypothetical protein